MASNEETYLEAFIESINDLPHEIKRDLELIGSLDRSCLTVTEELQNAQDELITKAEKKVMEMVENKKVQIDANNSEDQSSTANNETNAPKQQQSNNEISIPTTEELESVAWDPMAEETITQLRKKARLYHREKVIVAEHCLEIVQSTLSRLEYDISSFETLLKGSGALDSILLGTTGTLSSGNALTSLGQPNDLAAIQVDPNQNEWILAKIISRDPDTNMYKLSDEDTESDKVFTLPESQVVVLTGMEPLAKGDVIYAVYPDTTSFYQATVVQAPRKIYGGGANTAGSSSFVLVNFHDDGDEHGVTHDKAVLMRHVMRPPFLLP